MTLIHGDCLEVLKSLPTHSVDAIITDPPAGISFMSKAWDNPVNYFPLRDRTGTREDAPDSNGFARGINEVDHTKTGRDAFIAFIQEVFTEARRVLKPGGHALVWSLPRTSHWTAFALEEAGFEIRDSINHIFGSGMPKSHNIGKQIDKAAGATRKIVGTQHVKDIRRNVKADRLAGITHGQGKLVTGASDAAIQYIDHPITEPATLEAAQYAGYGTGLKPAHETWWLARSPLAENTIAANVLEYGTGALNIDASRIAAPGANLGRINAVGANGWKNASGGPTRAISDPVAAAGRWPANVLLSHSVFCVPRGLKEIPGNGTKKDSASNSTKNAYGQYNERSLISHTNENGRETMEDWECMPGCPVAELNNQSGNLTSGARIHAAGEASINNVFRSIERSQDSAYPASQGGASRYFQVFTGEYDCIEGCPVKELNQQSGNSQGHKNATSDNRMLANNKIYGKGLPGERTPDNSYDDNGGAARYFQTFDGYDCAEGCPIAALNQQSGISNRVETREAKAGRISIWGHENDYVSKVYDDQGGAARYFQNFQPDEPALEEWECIPECPIFQLNQQSGITQSGGHVRHNGAGKQGYGIDNPAFTTTGPTDKGGASRYFQNFYYCAKPSVKERNAGCGDLEAKQGFDKNTSKIIQRSNPDTGAIEEFEYVPSAKKNHHPTVKSIALMSYLIKMITPPGGVVLDMFGGSGTTALACIQHGFDYILIEREQEYIDIIAARIAYMEGKR